MAQKWFAVHRVDDGTLVSTGTDVAPDLPADLAVVELTKAPDDTVEWDPKARRMTARPDPAAARDKALTDRLEADPDYVAMSATEKRTVRVLLRALGR